MSNIIVEKYGYKRFSKRAGYSYLSTFIATKKIRKKKTVINMTLIRSIPWWKKARK